MSVPDRPVSSGATAHRRRVLDLVEFIALAIKEQDLDLDTIDGEFYWRCCRHDLFAQVRELRAAVPTLILSPEPPEDDDLLLKELLDRQEWSQQNMFLQMDAARLYPGSVWHRLVRGDWLPMRLPDVTHFVNGMDGCPSADRESLRITVYSGAWTGADVDRRVAESASRHRYWVPEDQEHGVNVRLLFRFLDGPEGEGQFPYYRAERYPCILVVVGFPLPPPGTIAREYDAIVRDQKQWHLALPGATSRQDKEVALRTWAVGLLVSAGVRFAAAMRDVCARGSLDEVSQARFGQDRQRLVERVPEAAEYLYARD